MIFVFLQIIIQNIDNDNKLYFNLLEKVSKRYRNYIIIKIIIFICSNRKKQINIRTNVRRIRLENSNFKIN